LLDEPVYRSGKLWRTQQEWSDRRDHRLLGPGLIQLGVHIAQTGIDLGATKFTNLAALHLEEGSASRAAQGLVEQTFWTVLRIMRSRLLGATSGGIQLAVGLQPGLGFFPGCRINDLQFRSMGCSNQRCVHRDLSLLACGVAPRGSCAIDPF